MNKYDIVESVSQEIYDELIDQIHYQPEWEIAEQSENYIILIDEEEGLRWKFILDQYHG